MKTQLLESLEARSYFAHVTADFDPDNGVLSVFGDQKENTITVSRTPAGEIRINGGNVKIKDKTKGKDVDPTVANTALIQVFGDAGDNVITLDESNGGLPKAKLFGGDGNDLLIGGSGADEIFGQGGHDLLLGKGGADLLAGGDDNDLLTGGDGDDQSFGEAGDDRMVWNPGDDTDLNEGGAGSDTVEVNGGNGAEAFTTTANGVRVRFDRLDPAPFAIDIGTSESLFLNANGGDDSFSATGNLATLIHITADGGPGNDSILGSNGADLLLGGDGVDFIDGQQGNDTAFLGAEDDVFQWDPGDGSDIVEGQDGFDTMIFNGSGASETIDASANGGRLRFTRNVGNIVMDTDDLERVDVNAVGGADAITFNDLSGTDVVEANVALAAIGGAGDGDPDTVIVNGTSGDDIVLLFGDANGVTVLGLAAQINVTTLELPLDKIQVNGLAGDDVIEASGLQLLGVTGNAGVGNDVLIGGDSDDLLLGEEGDDLLLGGAGVDVLDGGDGDDVEIQD